METNVRQPEREVRILGDALEALTRATGMKAKVMQLQPQKEGRQQPDAEFVLENAGKRTHYLVEIKPVDRTITLNQVKQQLLQYKKPGMLVTPYLTIELADYCRKIGLQFIDTAGNAYLHGPGLYVQVKGERLTRLDRRTYDQREKGAGTATALRVVFALLCKPRLLNAPYREIVKAAGVALGAVGWVFFDLERRGLTVGKRKEGRRVIDQTRLINEWITNYTVKLRPKLNARRFKATNLNLLKDVPMRDYGAVWGGEVAGDQLTGNREPNAYTIYVPGNPTKFIIDTRLRADPKGDVELLEKFWNFELDAPYPTNLAPPLLVYADLMATTDPRNHDTAKHAYKHIAKDAYRKN